jgi:adenylate kinase
MMRQTVLLFGPPGAGKGTQAKRLATQLRSPHVSTGDMFRDHQGRKSSLGLKVERILSTGALVPDSLTNEMVRERLLKPDAALGVILDGFPRNVAQAKWLTRFLELRGHGVRAVLVIEVPRAELKERLKGRALKEGRPDDADDAVIEKRIDTYVAQTEVCLDHFRKNGDPVHVIDGVGTIDEVEGRIRAALAVEREPA